KYSAATIIAMPNTLLIASSQLPDLGSDIENVPTRKNKRPRPIEYEKKAAAPKPMSRLVPTQVSRKPTTGPVHGAAISELTMPSTNALLTPSPPAIASRFL